MAASRVMDYHHHCVDVVAGSLLGTGVACVVFAARESVIARLMHREEEGEIARNGGHLYEVVDGQVEV